MIKAVTKERATQAALDIIEPGYEVLDVEQLDIKTWRATYTGGIQLILRIWERGF